MHQDQQCLKLSVEFDDAEDEHIAGCTLAPFALSGATKGGFIMFLLALEGLTQVLGIGAASSHKRLKSSVARRKAKPLELC